MTNSAVILYDNCNGQASGGGLNNTKATGDTVTTGNSWWTTINQTSGTLEYGSPGVRSSTCHVYTTTSGGASFPVCTRTIRATSSYEVFEAYVQFDSGAAAPTNNFAFLTIRQGGTNRAQVQMTTGGNLRIRNGTTAVGTMSTTITADTWYRIAWETDYTNTTQLLRLYAGNDVHNDPAGYTEEVTGNYTSDVADQYRFGFVETPGETASIRIDQPTISYDGFMGPTFGNFNGAGVAALDMEDATI